MKEIKNIEWSTISVGRISSDMVDGNGQRRIRVEFEELKEPINFGSAKNPKNRDVKIFKIEVPKEPPINFGDLFGGLFGKK